MNALDIAGLAETPWPESAVYEAVLRTVLYADVFDFALTPAEIHRTLDVPASRVESDRAVADACRRGDLRVWDGYVSLPGRENASRARALRLAQCERHWRLARRYGRLIWALPFVRLVAVSGALAAEDVREGSDIDFFVVTSPGRLWTVRGAIVLVCKVARRFGHELCPNYLVTFEALRLHAPSLYSARELSQLVPLHGAAVYDEMIAANRWRRLYQPNAVLPRRAIEDRLALPAAGWKRLGERLLWGRLGDFVERWERHHKLEQLCARVPPGVGEVVYGPNVCKGHDRGHAAHIRRSYLARLRRWGIDEANHPTW